MKPSSKTLSIPKADVLISVTFVLCLLNFGSWKFHFVLTCLWCKWMIAAESLYGRNVFFFSFRRKWLKKRWPPDTHTKRERERERGDCMLLGKIQEQDMETEIKDFSGDHPTNRNSNSSPITVPFPFLQPPWSRFCFPRYSCFKD